MKILRLEGGLALVYQCVRETFAGGCKAEGVRVYLLGRSPAAALDDMVPLLSALPAVCLKPENMKSVLSTGEGGGGGVCVHVCVYFISLHVL